MSENFRRFKFGSKNLYGVWRLLRGVGIVQGCLPGEDIMSVGFYSEVVGHHTKRNIERLVSQLVDFRLGMAHLYNIQQEIKGDWNGFMEYRFSEKWKRKRTASYGDLLKVVAPHERGQRFVRDFPEYECISLLEFNDSFLFPGIQSSDYWAEHKAGRIDGYTLGDSETFSAYGIFHRLMETAAYLPNCPMAKILYPRTYSFLCGQEIKSTSRFRLKFVATCNDTSPRGLLKMARHFVEHYYADTGDSRIKVEHDLDTVQVSDVCFYSCDPYEGNPADENDFWGDFVNYFEWDYDADGNITFVEFVCSVESRGYLVGETELSNDLSRYKGGVYMDFSRADFFQFFRDLFEHPLELCVSDCFLMTVPTLEEYRDFKYKQYFGDVWCLENMLRCFCDFGTINEWNLLSPLLKIMQAGAPKNCHLKIDYRGWHSPGVLSSPGDYETFFETVDSWIHILQSLLDNWDLVRSRKELAKKITDVVSLDPLLYTDSDIEEVVIYANGLIE